MTTTLDLRTTTWPDLRVFYVGGDPSNGAPQEVTAEV